MYIDAWLDNKNNVVKVIERDETNTRVILDYPCVWEFYHDDLKGQYKNPWKEPIKKVTCNSRKELLSSVSKLHSKNIKTYESDINVVFKTLSNNYANTKMPELNTMFFDIEVEVNSSKGFAKPNDPWAPITAITAYTTKNKFLRTWALVPKTITQEIINEIHNKFENCELFDTEVKLLESFMDTLEDVDVISGWNSTGYDIPYTVNRIRKVAKHLDTKWCIDNIEPIRKKYVKFKKINFTYEFVGRTHLDYLELYQKHNGQQLHSYRLDFVAEHEIKQNKIPYEGTLEELYLYDFVKFIEYNRQDVMLIVLIDDNKKFIELANVVAHNACVLLKHTMGTVVMTEQSIINQFNLLSMKVCDKVKSDNKFSDDAEEDLDLFERLDNAAKKINLKFNHDDSDDEDDEEEENDMVVGAFVAEPKKGLHSHIGAIDINSLYPSLIRALNMSPETLFAQVLPTLTDPWLKEKLKTVKKPTEAWDNVFSVLEYDEIIKQSDVLLTVLLIRENKTFNATAKEIYEWVFSENSNICISANGTIFNTSFDGVIPLLLTKWYAERKMMQAQEKAVSDFEDGTLKLTVEESLANHIRNNLNHTNKLEVFDIGNCKNILESQNVQNIIEYFNTRHLTINENGIVIGKDIDLKYWKKFWNSRQQAKKINLNALYGALLNEGLRFFDIRLGQSTTMSGRMVVRHMNAQVNKEICDEYDYNGNSVVYSDTDSCHSKTLINIGFAKYTIEDLFNLCPIKWNVGDKEYSVDENIKVLSYNPETQQAEFMPINYVYRHKVLKEKWKVEDQFGNELIITGDHSVMIERNNELLEIKPRDIKEDDIIITVIGE